MKIPVRYMWFGFGIAFPRTLFWFPKVKASLFTVFSFLNCQSEHLILSFHSSHQLLYCPSGPLPLPSILSYTSIYFVHLREASAFIICSPRNSSYSFPHGDPLANTG